MLYRPTLVLLGETVMALPAFLARLLILTGAYRLFPSLQRRLDGGADTLRYWSARLLEAPFDDLGKAGECLAGDGVDLASGSPAFDLGTGTPRLPADQRGLPPWQGLPSLRGAIAAHLLDEHGLTCHPADELLVTPGGMGAVQTVLDAFVDRGDGVVLPDPVSPLFPLLLKGRGAKLRWVPGRNDDGVRSLRLDTLSHALRGAKLLVLCSPCNPTGAAYTPEALAQIAWWCQRRDVLILSDESFAGLSHDDGHTATATHARGRTLTVGSLSKGHGLAWARVGWLAGPRHLMKACGAAAALRGPFVPTLSQLAGLAALREDGARESARQRLEARRGYVLDRLKGMGLDAAWPAAGFFAWFPVPAGHADGTAFAEALWESRGVRVLPGTLCGPSGKRQVRLSFGGDEGRLEEGLNRLGDFVRQARIKARVAVAA